MNKPRNKNVANRGDIAYEDSLPFRHVYYPGYYGTFLGFSDNKDSNVFFCSCSKAAITLYLQLTHELNIFRMAVDRIIASYKDFPELIINDLLSKNASNDSFIIKYLNFKDSLCHICNRSIPHYRYCSEVYGGIFQQTYGWYIDQELFKCGIDPGGFHFAPRYFPERIVTVLKEASEEYKKEYSEMFMLSPF